MNYCTITINGEKIGLKFGMASYRYLSQNRLVEGKSFQNNELTEIGLAHILYSGHYNNSIVKDIEPTLTFENFVDYVEANISNDAFLDEVKKAIDIWASTDFVKKSQEVQEPKKKSSRGKK